MIGWQVKAIAAAVVLTLIGYLMWREHSLTRLVAKKEAALIVANKTIKERDGQLEQARKDAERQRIASNEYQTELERLQAARVDTPTRVVRLCRSAPADVPATASGPDETGPERLPVEAGPDIGERLYALADEADRCAAQRDGLIKWYSAR